MTVTVTEDDKYLIGENEIQVQDLIQTIKDESKEKSDGLLIQASGNSSHQSVVRLMDTARNAGVQSISIVEL